MRSIEFAVSVVPGFESSAATSASAAAGCIHASVAPPLAKLGRLGTAFSAPPGIRQFISSMICWFKPATAVVEQPPLTACATVCASENRSHRLGTVEVAVRRRRAAARDEGNPQ